MSPGIFEAGSEIPRSYSTSRLRKSMLLILHSLSCDADPMRRAYDLVVRRHCIEWNSQATVYFYTSC